MLSTLFDLRNGKEGGGNCLQMRQIICIIHSMRAGIAQSVHRISNTTGGETVQTGPGTHVASYSGLNISGRGFDHTPYLTLMLRMFRAYLNSPSVLSFHVMEQT